MKALPALFVFLMVQGSFAACPDLSGLYEFKGFQDNKCHTFRSYSGHSTPLPIGLAITAGDRIRIRQDGCLTITFTYPDHRTDPAGDAVRTLRLDQLQTGKKRIADSASRDERIYGFGYFSGSSSWHWSLSLTEDSDLQIRYRTSMSGAINGAPFFEFARSRCTLKRIE
jgi:hypothetical protein